MKKIRLVIVFLCLLSSAFFLLSCASTPEVDREEILSRGDTREVRGRIFVSPTAKQRVYQKVAVMPFRAPVELAGSSISDMFATEISRTYKYQLVERSQMEQVLGEQALGLKGVTENVIAMKIGKILGVQGVIVGTVPEYGSKASGKAELSAIGINVRMIDVSDGSVVWSFTDTAISDKPVSLSAFANRMVRNMVDQLTQEWIKSGDTMAANIPPPQIIASFGKIRGTIIDILPDSPKEVTGYIILRSRSEKGPYQEVASLENTGSKTIRFEDQNLLDAETYFYKISAKVRSGFTGMPVEPIKITTAGPPGAITGLTAQSGIIRKVALAWQPSPDPNTKGYFILRKTAETPWAKIQTLENPTQSSFTDQGLEDNKTYSYRVTTYNVVGSESPPSQVVTATTKGAPSSPQKLEALSKQARKVPLMWTPVLEPEVKGYAIYRAMKAEGPFEKIAFVEGKEQSKYTDGGKKGYFSDEAALQDDTPYYYKVRAVNVVEVESPDSPMNPAVTKPVPGPVTGLTANQFEVKQVSLQWQPNPEKDIVKYELFRGESPNAIDKQVLDAPASNPQAVDKGLKDGTQYYHKIRAVDQDGLKGKLSEAIVSTTKPLPKKPQGLKVLLEGSQVKLNWQPNPEPDIAKYIISQKGFLFWDKIGESTETGYLFTGEMKKGKTLTFRIIAVDKTNLESEASEEANITIP